MIRGAPPLPQASRNEVGKALHKALSGGHVEVVETIRDVLGPRFTCRTPGGWPLGVKGATLVHSAADNSKGDARCVWLALEAEGEPPCAGDEEAAAALARAAAAVEPPPPPSSLVDYDRRSGRTSDNDGRDLSLIHI